VSDFYFDWVLLCFEIAIFLDASRISQYLLLRDPDTFSWSPLPTHASVEDCPQGMHQDLMFIPRKGTRRGLASRGKALVLAALPGFIDEHY